MSTRCTPFGLFAGVSLGELGQESDIELMDSRRYYRHTRLDMNYLCNLIQDICKLPEARMHLKYYPNNSIYRLGAKLRYVEYYYKNARRVHNISAVNNSEYINTILKKSRFGATIRELANLLIDDDISLEDAAIFINELIDNQILVSELEPAITGKDFLVQISTVLQSIQEMEGTNKKLAKITNLLSEIDTSKIGDALPKYFIIEEVVRELKTTYEARFLFQTDMFKPTSKAILNKKIIQDIQDALELMNKFSYQSSETFLSKFAENYYERYEDKEMPLLQVLDNENGIGYHQSAGDINPLLIGYILPMRQSENIDIKWNRIQSVLFKKFLKAHKNNAYCMEIEEKDFDFLTANWEDLPLTISVMCEIFSNKRDEPLIYLHGFGGSGVVNLLGRFCHINKEFENYAKEITKFEQSQTPDFLYAEIIHLPESRIGNIILRPVLRPYEIPYLGKSSVKEEYQIPLSDLYVSVKGKNILLRSKRLNKQIVPRLSTAHNFRFNSMPVYRFLCDMQTQGLRNNIGFSWGNLANEYEFLPRIIYKENVILSLAKWTVQTADFIRLLELDNKKRGKKDMDLRLSKTAKRNLKKWREEKQIPRYVVLPDGDNELFVDMENSLSIQTLISVIKKRTLFQLEEFLFDHENPIVKDINGNGFTNEFIFGFHKIKNSEESS